MNNLGSQNSSGDYIERKNVNSEDIGDPEDTTNFRNYSIKNKKKKNLNLKEE